MDNNFNNQQTVPNQGGNNLPPISARHMKTNRSMLVTVLLNLITYGIYSLIFYNSVSDDINFIASRRDGKKTMNYILLFFLIGPITLEIATVVWFHKISNRIGDEARARGINSSFGAGSFWLWNVLGALIIIGPFIYLSQLCKTMNSICADYNQRGCPFIWLNTLYLLASAF